MTDAAGRHEQPAGAIRVTVAGPVTGPATRERRDRGDRAESGDGSYFAPLARARYLLLTTFRQKGTPVSAVVQGVADGDRAYFRVRSRSGTARRLRHTDGVQVAPCSALGLWSYGPPLDAAVRPLAGEEASRVAGQLDRTYPVRHRSLAWPVHRAWRRRLAYYELLLRVSCIPAEPPRIPETASIARPGPPLVASRRRHEYPRPGHRLCLQPGDAMSASVVANGGGAFTLTLTDSTQGWTRTTSQTACSDRRARRGGSHPRDQDRSTRHRPAPRWPHTP